MIEPSFGAAILLVNGLIEVVKMTGLKGLDKFYPLMAEAIGFILGMGIGLGWFASLFIGLASMGLYDVAWKPVKEKISK